MVSVVSVVSVVNSMSNPYKRVLLVGSHGMLAHAVRRTLMRRGVEPVGVDHEHCDITLPQSVRAVFETHRPTLVVNCAAYTAVDKAEQEEELATRINGDGPRNLAEACMEMGATLVHFSTDFVFDGTATEPYRVEDKPEPLGAYGRSKLAGDIAIEDTGLGDWLTIRTSWLYGAGPGRPFPKVILEAARAGKPLRVVSDQRGSPTFTCDLAQTTLDLLDAEARGLFHVTNAGHTTWFEFTQAICETFRVTPTELSPTTAADWAKMKPDSAPRPAYSVLDLSRTEGAVGRPMRHWRQALEDYHMTTGGNP